MTIASMLFCALIIVVASVDAARILGVIPTASYSHQVMFHPLWRELSLRGHQVTTITTDPINDPKLVNLTEIDLHCLYNLINTDDMGNIVNFGILKAIFTMIDLTEVVTRALLSHHQVQELLKNDTEKFDVVLVEYGVLPLLAFAKRFEAPLITVISIDAPSDLLTLLGNPTHPILYPNWYMHAQENLSLLDRLIMVGLTAGMDLFKLAYVDPIQQSLINDYFGFNYPKITELEKDISLVLMNSDPSFHRVKPLLPTVIQIGGGSRKTPPKPLPTELQTILDATENGFIYFSLGSNVKSKDLSVGMRNAILETFSELPYTVLWKFEADDFLNKSKNVITAKWLPQQDILHHSKIKLFITQGGLQSINEAIYDHVPMIGMPFFADQNLNANVMVAKGIGLSIDYKTLRKEEFKAAILEVINNPSYRNKITELAQLALDQPMTSLEKAVWWTEYVIRHNGTKHLRSPLLDIPFYQYYLLDVMGVLLLAVIVLISIFVFSLKSLNTFIRKLSSNGKIKKN